MLSSAFQGFLITLGNGHLLGMLRTAPGQLAGHFRLHLCLKSLYPHCRVIAGYDNSVFRHSLQDNFVLMKKGKENWVLHFGAMEL